MPGRAFCQGFVGIFSIGIYINKTMSYESIRSKCFKIIVKKITLLLKNKFTTYCGSEWAQKTTQQGQKDCFCRAKIGLIARLELPFADLIYVRIAGLPGQLKRHGQAAKQLKLRSKL